MQAMFHSTRLMTSCALTIVKRNFGITAVVAQNLDPIQKLFADKIKDYATKSKAAGGTMVDVTATVEKDLTAELEKLERSYQATGQDMTKFPTFNFTDTELLSVDINVDPKEAQAKHESDMRAEQEASAAGGDNVDIDENTPHFNY